MTNTQLLPRYFLPIIEDRRFLFKVLYVKIEKSSPSYNGSIAFHSSLLFSKFRANGLHQNILGQFYFEDNSTIKYFWCWQSCLLTQCVYYCICGACSWVLFFQGRAMMRMWWGRRRRTHKKNFESLKGKNQQTQFKHSQLWLIWFGLG